MGSGYNYTLRYRTFDQVLEDVKVDFQNLTLQNMIEPQQLIKVVKRVNYDLGLRIMSTKEDLLEVSKSRVKLPNDFQYLNYALMCVNFTEHTVLPQGTHIEERNLTTPYKETNGMISTCVDGTVNCQSCQQCSATPCSCTIPVTPAACSSQPFNPLVPFGDSCIKPRVFMNCKGDCYEIVQVVNTTQTNTYKTVLPIRMLDNPEMVDCDCPNLSMRSEYVAWIKDNYLYTNFDCGNVYINYQGALEDDNGNLLAPDHDMLNEYYEYAIKKRILENMIMNDETVSQAKIQLINDGYRTSRNYALSIVNTPNFAEMKKLWAANRKAQYARYYDMFKSHTWYSPYINQR